MSRKQVSTYGTYTANGFVPDNSRDNSNVHPKSGCGGVLFILLTGILVVSTLAYFAF